MFESLCCYLSNTEIRMKKTVLHLPEEFAILAAALARKVHERPASSGDARRTPPSPLRTPAAPVLHDMAQIINVRHTRKHSRQINVNVTQEH
jgi:hypothetical protein